MQKRLGFFREDCRLCHSRNLVTFLDLGMQPHSDGFVRADQLSQPEHVFPLAVALCKDCGQWQLTYTVDPLLLYANSEYLYDSSITETGKKHFLAMAQSIVKRFALPKDGLAIDIGSNVGLLLSGFKAEGMRVHGVDPAPKPAAIANKNGIETTQELFSLDVAKQIVANKGQASVMTGTNVFAHIDDLDAFMSAVDTLLLPEGILIIEAPYAVDLLEKLEYDTVYHQHLSYLSIAPLTKFFARFGMELFDVERTTIHGGSIRLFVGRAEKHPVTPIIGELTTLEKKQQLHDLPRLETFALDVSKHRQALTEMLMKLKDEGKTIIAVSAPAKGNTLLNYCTLNTSILDCVTEKNTLKVGLFTPGMHLPVVADAELMSRQPDYALILAWNFADEIMKNLAIYHDKGGKFIIPIPTPTIV